LLLLMFISHPRAQVKIDVIELLTDSTRTDSTRVASPDSLAAMIADSIASDSMQARAQKPVFNFQMPQAAFVISPAGRAEYLFQDLSQLLSYGMPVIPLMTGEVGWPRYISTGELPSRAIATMVDSVWWIPGVYGNVDLTNLPEPSNTFGALRNTPQLFLPSHGLASSFALSHDTLNFAQPLSEAEYAKGPYGADAVRVNFSRAFSRRIAGLLHATFSNSEGQFEDFPYDGHKAMGRFDYRLNQSWRVRYRHFNSRNQAGIAVPFFLEEQPELTNASHKEERLYHAVELTRAHAFTLRAFAWQVKEELNDAARQIRHRLRDRGGEGSWQLQRERFALSAHARLGSEAVRSTSIFSRARFYQELAANMALRFHETVWLQGAGQFRHKQNWPNGYSFALAGFYQPEKEKLFWAKAGLYQIPPALAERDNTLRYLARNEKLQAAQLQHAQLGARLRFSNAAVQFALGNAMWERGFLFVTDTAVTTISEFEDSVQVAITPKLFNQQKTKSALGAQMSLRWQLWPNLLASMHGVSTFRQPTKQFWFWYQPESHVRASLETRVLLFEKTLEVLPRFSANYLGERVSPIFTASSASPSFKTLKAVATFDFHLRLLYGNGALFFSWENLLDERFDLREGVPHPGRIFRWGFWWKFLN